MRLQEQILGNLPVVATNKHKDARLNHLTRALNTVHGNVFAPEFRQFLNADNWKRAGPRTFFTDITTVQCTSSFLMPHANLVPFKDFLIPLFAICALWDPAVLRLMVLNDQKATREVRVVNKFTRSLYRRAETRTGSCGTCRTAWIRRTWAG